jgi:SAM-dependent methyltransferase
VTGAGGFDPRYVPALAAVEQRHFWFRARNRIISTLARQIVRDFAPGYRVLDAGCGTGNTLRALKDACSTGSLFGADLYLEGLRFARRVADARVVQADVGELPFGSRFHLIGLFDVLEHIDEDAASLARIVRALDPAGAVLITVPADRGLWSYFDEAAHHCRRYTIDTLRTCINAAGLSTEFISPFMTITYPLLRLSRAVGRIFGQSQPAAAARLYELRVVPVLNPLLEAALAPETRALAARRTLPFGASLVAVARPRLR